MSASENNDDSQFPATRVERLLKRKELSRTGDHGSSASPLADCESAEGRERPILQQRLLVVANRLPVSAVRGDQKPWSLETNPGGLVSALLGVKEFEARWIGWPGVNVPDELGQQELTRTLAEKNCIPVFLSEEIVDQYYNGYCNNILWPLFHYLGLPQEDATTGRFQSQLEAYKKANQMFADVVIQHYKEGDVVWCHDYHLMFLPEKLKEYNSEMKVGWFLHTPFPSSEIHRTLPSCSELLRGVLAADLVGFHTYDYARHFVRACTHILGLEGTPYGVEDQGRLTRVAAFPIGIDAESFIRALETPRVQDFIKEFKEGFSGRKVILGVDRLDMIKGIPQKVLAFEKFLEDNPDWRHKVVLLQIAVPTRTDVLEYQKLKSQVHEIVGRINGRFGSFTAIPIHHLDQSLEFHALCALYSVTDVALVTSLRDGMNLVSYEFVACQESKNGVLILSEFAGAAQSLGAGAILVNPWNIDEVASAIHKALNMPAEERGKRQRLNLEHVTTHTSQKWAELFLSELNDAVIEAQQRKRNVPPQLVVSDAVRRYSQCKSRLLVLGFNAVLTEPTETPRRRGEDQIKAMELKLHPDLKEPLKMLCRDPNTTVLVLSGSNRRLLDDNFGEYDMWLGAENGMFLRHTKGEWGTVMPEHVYMDWCDNIKKVLEYFTERTPRSHFEPRETTLVWNYKYADVDFGTLQARDMLQNFLTGPIANSVDVVQGSRSVEVRPAGVSKGVTISRILVEICRSKTMRMPIDYVLCLGHFLGKDEDIYTYFEPELPPDVGSKYGSERRASPKHEYGSSSSSRAAASPESSCGQVMNLEKDDYFSCAVGITRTSARYVLSSSDAVVAFLKELAAASEATIETGSEVVTE